MKNKSYCESENKPARLTRKDRINKAAFHLIEMTRFMTGLNKDGRATATSLAKIYMQGSTKFQRGLKVQS